MASDRGSDGIRHAGTSWGEGQRFWQGHSKNCMGLYTYPHTQRKKFVSFRIVWRIQKYSKQGWNSLEVRFQQQLQYCTLTCIVQMAVLFFVDWRALSAPLPPPPTRPGQGGSCPPPFRYGLPGRKPIRAANLPSPACHGKRLKSSHSLPFT